MNAINKIKGNLQKNVYDYLENFFPEEQKQINDEDAENALIYGIRCFRVKDNKFQRCEICLSVLYDNKLDFFNKEKSKVLTVDFELIDNITFKHLSKVSQLFNFNDNYNFLCDILIKKTGYKYLFQLKKTALLFVKGLLIACRKYYENYNSYVDIPVDKFNTNFNNELEDDELKYLASYLGVEYLALKKEIDINKDNTISIEEFKNYVKKRISGEQFRPIFEKYSTLVYNNKEKVLGPIDLQNFFKDFQKEEISYLEACQIIIEFNSIKENIKKINCIQSFENLLLSGHSFNAKDIESILNHHNKDIITNNNQNPNAPPSSPLKLYLTLYEFNMMLHSLLLTVYDNNKLNKKLDIDHPLTDYFINSSHNTYLKGHQLIGKSSSKMYSTSLLYKFRMVELDCYEGEGNEIVITHGYTLVDDLSLEDVLIELKETAFINSDLPVILSIENHLGEKYQEIMVEKIKTILKDLYIFPRNVMPDHLPNLRDLKKKFLIKCGGSKLWLNETIPVKQHVKQVYNLNNSFLLEQILNPSNQLIEKKIIFLDKISQTKKKREKSVDPKVRRARNLQFNKKKREEEKTIVGLENILGLVGVKFDNEKVIGNYYKPWEMMTIKCSKATKFSEDTVLRKNIFDLTKHCLLRIYPENFDSSNYNIIKCFACGIQGCCLNIQATNDDFTLYNKIFFKQNEGFGYVLKPERFFQEFNSYYDRASYVCKIKIVSLFNFSKLIEEEHLDINDSNKLNLSIYVIGTKEDENNQKYDFKLINGSMFPSFEKENQEVVFKVYDFDLSAIMIKIKLADTIIGRGCIPYSFMKLGFRRIPIYDKQCFNMKDVYMVGHFSLDKF